jgi:hypothetical protein
LQEFFLVVPKAFIPGLHPTLFHNNHSWTGHNPVADLLQGTGALADLTSGLLFALLLARSAQQPATIRMFLFWMADQGFFLALPQFVIGAINPANDAGTAIAYLGFSAAAKLATASIALLAMAALGFWLARQFVRLMGISAETATPAARLWFVFQSATLPALASVVLLVPFREPREMIEVLLVPLIVTISGILWSSSAPASRRRPTRQNVEIRRSQRRLWLFLLSLSYSRSC